MIPHHNPGSINDPVTVIVTRKAKKGKIKEFEEWMDGITHEALKFEGHMGVNIIRPADPTDPSYVIIFRFNNYGNLLNWERSDERKKWIEKGEKVTEGEVRVERLTGLEFWFTPGSTGRQAAPPRYKMALVTGTVIFVLLGTLIPQLQLVTKDFPPLLGILTGVAIMVPLMTFVIMPLITRVLGPWLFKKTFL
ncbi:MAG: antibiotic biosynthesis monooxygenase [Thermodesulfobacteriota bacterium]